jgi:hypothetical protein
LDLSIPVEGSLANALVHSRGRAAAVVTKSGELAVLDWSASPKLNVLDSALATLRAAAFAPSGQRVAISDGTVVEVWTDLRGTPARAARLRPQGGVHAVALSEDGLLAVGTVEGIDIIEGAETRRILSGMSIGALAFSGRDLLAGVGNTLHIVRDAVKATGSAAAVPLDREILSLAASDDGVWAAAAVADDVLAIQLTEARVTALGCGCQASRLDPLDGNLVVAATDSRTGALVLLNLGATPQLARIPGFGGSAQ